MSALRIATLFPLATAAAGDEANSAALLRRAAARGLEAEAVTVNRPDDLVDAGIYLLGGTGRAGVGALVELLTVSGFADRLRAEGRTGEAPGPGAPVVFAVDSAMDALGRTWVAPDGRTRAGLGVLGAESRPARQVIGTVVTRPVPELGLPAMIGWESHDVATVRDPGVRELAGVEVGAGDRGSPGADGALDGSVVATRLHGPVLALNPELADLLLERALGGPQGWPALPVPTVDRARAVRIEEARRAAAPGTQGSRWRRSRRGR